MLAFHPGAKLKISHLAHQVKEDADPVQRGTLDWRTVQDELIARQGGIKGHLGASVEPVQVHGDGSVGGEAEEIVAVAPVLDKGDVRMALSDGRWHAASLPRECRSLYAWSYGNDKKSTEAFDPVFESQQTRLVPMPVFNLSATSLNSVRARSPAR